MKDAIYEIRLEAKKKKHRYKPQQIPHLTNTCHEYRTNTGSGSAVNLPSKLRLIYSPQAQIPPSLQAIFPKLPSKLENPAHKI
jgi:hypothetical protein